MELDIKILINPHPSFGLHPSTYNLGIQPIPEEKTSSNTSILWKVIPIKFFQFSHLSHQSMDWFKGNSTGNHRFFD
jgi:hypothetical protein